MPVGWDLWAGHWLVLHCSAAAGNDGVLVDVEQAAGDADEDACLPGGQGEGVEEGH